MENQRRAIKNLRKLDIAPDSELGQALLKLDATYELVDTTVKQIAFLNDKKKQLLEDIEVMELMLMHKFNKDTRASQWASGR